MTALVNKITAEEFFTMPNDGHGYELVKGELKRKGDPHTMSPTGFRHGAIVARLTAALVQHIDLDDLGEVTGAETGFQLARNPDTVRAPDVAFVRRERIPAGELTERFWPGAPDLAAEVISPNDTLYQVDEKVEDYLASGVRLVWIVNPKKRTVTAHRPGTEAQTLMEDDMLDGLDVVPGFEFSLAKLFSRKR